MKASQLDWNFMVSKLSGYGEGWIWVPCLTEKLLVPYNCGEKEGSFPLMTWPLLCHASFKGDPTFKYSGNPKKRWIQRSGLKLTNERTGCWVDSKWWWVWEESGEYDQNMFCKFLRKLIKICLKEIVGEEEEFHVSVSQYLLLFFP